MEKFEIFHPREQRIWGLPRGKTRRSAPLGIGNFEISFSGRNFRGALLRQQRNLRTAPSKPENLANSYSVNREHRNVLVRQQKI